MNREPRSRSNGTEMAAAARIREDREGQRLIEGHDEIGLEVLHEDVCGRLLCRRDAPREAVQHLLDSTLGTASQNVCYEVDTKQALGLPAVPVSEAVLLA